MTDTPRPAHRPLLSDRVPHATSRNRLTARLDALRADGVAIADLTESNPTRVGLSYPSDLLAQLSCPAALRYEPDPRGLISARRAVATEYARRGRPIDPDHLVLTASTSEAYTWLFKLFCRPGDRVLVPRPSYPLFEHLARLEGVGLRDYDLHWRGRWDIDLDQIRHAPDDVRALVVVSPNNPTGSCISAAEFGDLATICVERGWPLIVDEVFVDYPLESSDHARDLAAASPCLTMSLGGLSKSIGLPQLKLGWIAVGGPTADRDRALSALELIGDSFLSVATPVQLALADLLQRGAVIRQAIAARLRTNLSTLREIATQWAECSVPAVDGGWSAVIRVPATRSEETLALEILEYDHVLVHPGYFFDFRHEAFLVISLLVEPRILQAALPRALERARHEPRAS